MWGVVFVHKKTRSVGGVTFGWLRLHPDHGYTDGARYTYLDETALCEHFADDHIFDCWLFSQKSCTKSLVLRQRTYHSLEFGE